MCEKYKVEFGYVQSDQEREDFISKLRYVCFVKKIKRKDLAKNSGVPMSTMNNIFAGKSFSYSRMVEIRNATGLTKKEFESIEV